MRKWSSVVLFSWLVLGSGAVIAAPLAGSASHISVADMGFKGIIPGSQATVAREQIEKAGIVLDISKSPLMTKKDSSGNIISKTFLADPNGVTIAEKPIKNICFTFMSGRPEPVLIGISVFVKSDDVSEIREALVSKYGEPSEKSSLTASWVKSGSELIVAAYVGNDFRTGVVGFNDTDGNKRIAKLENAKAAGDL